MSRNGDGGKLLGVLLAAPASRETLETAVGVASAARSLGHRVRIFLVSDGVEAARDPAFLSLIDRGVEVVACALNCSERGVEADPRVVLGSQYDLAAMTAAADALLALT